MPYSQKLLIELMKAGAVAGETKAPKHLETVISNVFIFDENVYKFYKNDNEFFNREFRDISDRSKRLDFTSQDFDWNQTLSPLIYLELIGVRVEAGKIVFRTPRSEAEELMIVMKRINSQEVLYEKLMAGEISEQDCFQIGKQLAQGLDKIQTKIPEGHNFFQVFQSRISDLRSWIGSVGEYVSEEEGNRYCDFLNRFCQENRLWFEGQLTSEILRDGDFHSHNAIYSKGSLFLMDTFPPKEEWAIGHKLIPLYRIGVDIWALSSKKSFFEALIKGYEEGSRIKVDRQLDNLYIVYASGIAVSYLYMLQRTDKRKEIAAKRFHQFLRDYYQKLSV